MTVQKNNLFLVILLQFFCVYVLASDETNEQRMEIKAYSYEINVGEPLVLDIIFTCKTPNINSKTGEIITSGKMYAPYLFAIKKGQKEEIKYESKFNRLNKPDFPIIDKGKKGLEYTGSFIVFYDQVKKGLFFNQPGVYSCRLEDARDKIKSNTIEINVKPSGKQEEKAMSILADKDDLMILECEDYIHLQKEVLERFKQVIEQCPDTMIAKMAAAHVGMALNDEYARKRQTTNIEEWDKLKPLKEKSVKYFQIGLKLPDEFQIRETILYMLAELEFRKDEKNYMQAKSYLEEITEKYPYGRWGKTAISGIEEVKTMMANDPNWTNNVQTKEEEKETQQY